MDYAIEIEKVVSALDEQGMDEDVLYDELVNYRDSLKDSIERKYDNKYDMVMDIFYSHPVYSLDRVEKDLNTLEKLKIKQLQALDKKAYWYLMDKYGDKIE